MFPVIWRKFCDPTFTVEMFAMIWSFKWETNYHITSFLYKIFCKSDGLFKIAEMEYCGTNMYAFVLKLENLGQDLLGNCV